MNHDLFFQAANTGALGRDRVPEVWSVSQVNALARKLLEGSLPLIWVAGEVSGFKRYAAGHCFFTLKDKGAQLSCVMWREAARSLPAEPPEGMAVHALGYLSIYERAGRFQFVVRELTAKGEGLWRLAFERLRAKLEAEGLLDPARKREIPSHPACVGVITSPEGAAVRDIISSRSSAAAHPGPTYWSTLHGCRATKRPALSLTLCSMPAGRPVPRSS